MNRFPVLSRALAREGLRLADAYLRGELDPEIETERQRSWWTPEQSEPMFSDPDVPFSGGGGDH